MVSVISTEAVGKKQTGKMGVGKGVPSVPWGGCHPWWVKTFESAATESPTLTLWSYVSLGETKLQFVTEALEEGGRHLHLPREENLLFFQPQHQL